MIQGDLIVQTPLEPTRENMKYHRDCINPMKRTQASMIHMSDVPEVVAPNLELSWLIPIIAPYYRSGKSRANRLCKRRGGSMGLDTMSGT